RFGLVKRRCHPLCDLGVEGRKLRSAANDEASSFAFHAVRRLCIKDQRTPYTVPAGLRAVDDPSKLLPTNPAFAIESGQKDSPLVLEGLVDAARSQFHGLRQVGDRGRMVAPLAENPR